MVYDLDSIKQRNPIADVIAAHGVALRESRSHLVGHCPFHEDEHPSFAVYPETRSFFCFGCRADNLSFREAFGRLSNGQPAQPSSPSQQGTPAVAFSD